MHTTEGALSLLDTRFQGGLISRFSADIEYPSHSCDFWFWNHLKSRVYPTHKTVYKSDKHLYDAVMSAALTMTLPEIQKAINNIQSRLVKCKAADGKSFKHFKST